MKFSTDVTAGDLSSLPQAKGHSKRNWFKPTEKGVLLWSVTEMPAWFNFSLYSHRGETVRSGHNGTCQQWQNKHNESVPPWHDVHLCACVCKWIRETQVYYTVSWSGRAQRRKHTRTSSRGQLQLESLWGTWVWILIKRGLFGVIGSHCWTPKCIRSGETDADFLSLSYCL